jgi:ATP-binding cassette, subfamily B, bacterial
MTDLHRLLAFALPYRVTLALSGLLMVLESAAALAIPWLGGRLAEVLLQAGAPAVEVVPAVLAGLLLLFGLQALLKFGNTYLLGGASAKIAADLKIRLYDHLQALPISFFHQRRQGDTLALLTHDVYVVGDYVSGTALAVVPLLLTVAGAMFFMFRLQPALAVLAVFLIPLFYLLIKIVGRHLRPLAQQLQQEHANAVAIAEENLGMLPAIKTFTREPHESRRHRGQVNLILRLSVRQLLTQAALGPAVQFVAAAGIVLVLWLASGEIADGRLAPAELVSFLLYAQLLTRPVAGLADVYGQTQTVRGSLTRLLRALDEPTEAAAHAGVTMPPVKGAIAFEGLSFSYPGRPPALQRVDLHIAAGETVAIIGPNGAGKSTLAHLLMRLHHPSAGRILIDGIDIASVSLHSLRSQIGVVPQNVLLFNNSVRDNIAYGRPEPTQKDIEAAARAARAHDFIVALPQGYDTLIGDRGVRLSGGQQQRLALARALLKDPPILILDEATAMFDPQGEIEFIEAARESLRGRTVLLITHRPESLAVADRIVKMEDGHLADAPAGPGIQVPISGIQVPYPPNA